MSQARQPVCLLFALGGATGRFPGICVYNLLEEGRRWEDPQWSVVSESSLDSGPHGLAGCILILFESYR